MHGVLLELTVILVLGTLLAFIFYRLKQSVILAYILTGILLGPLHIFGAIGTDQESLKILSDMGITLLLFLLGLELKIGELKSIGKVALITGIGQIVATVGLGFGLSALLGFGKIQSAYIAIALTFSSTIMIVKLLSDKKEINSLYGRISVGFLLVQDFFAILSLVVLSGLQDGGSGNQIVGVVGILIKTFIIFSVVVYLSNSVFPWIVGKMSASNEMLFTFSIAWAFGLSALISSHYIGLSIEIGGFLAGLSLANSVESFQIVSKVRALKDFFIIIFFVTLGMSLQFTNINDALIPAIVFSIFVIVGNPIIVMIILGLLGYRKRTGFLAGLTVAQISEFSLIVIFLGNQLGDVSNNVVSIVTLVGIITFSTSSYLITHGDRVYKFLDPALSLFERKDNVEDDYDFPVELTDHIVLIGAHRMGMRILKGLEKIKDQVLVIDYDPNIIHKLSKKKFNVIFGDIADSDIREKAKLENASIIISTIPNYEETLLLIYSIESINPKVTTMVTADQEEYVKSLKKAGADYIIQPYKLTGDVIADALLNKNFDKLKLAAPKA